MFTTNKPDLDDICSNLIQLSSGYIKQAQKIPSKTERAKLLGFASRLEQESETIMRIHEDIKNGKSVARC